MCTIFAFTLFSLLFFLFFFFFFCMRTSRKERRMRVRLSFPLSFLFVSKEHKEISKAVCIVLKEKKCQRDRARLVLSQRNVCRIFMLIRKDLVQIRIHLIRAILN